MVSNLVLVLVAAALLTVPAAAQLPEDTPPCVYDILELSTTQTSECQKALNYILKIYSDVDNGAEAPTREEIDRDTICKCGVKYSPEELVLVDDCLDEMVNTPSANLTDAEKEELKETNLFNLQKECKDYVEGSGDETQCPAKSNKKKCQKTCAGKVWTLGKLNGCAKVCTCGDCPASKSKAKCQKACSKKGYDYYWEKKRSDGCAKICTCVEAEPGTAEPGTAEPSACPEEVSQKKCTKDCAKQSLEASYKKIAKVGPDKIKCKKVCECVSPSESSDPEPSRCPAEVGKKKCTKQCAKQDLAAQWKKKVDGCKKVCECVAPELIACPAEVSKKACKAQCSEQDLTAKWKKKNKSTGCNKLCECISCPAQVSKKACEAQCAEQDLTALWKKKKKGCKKVCKCVDCPVPVGKADCDAQCAAQNLQAKWKKKKKGCSKVCKCK